MLCVLSSKTLTVAPVSIIIVHVFAFTLIVAKRDFFTEQTDYISLLVVSLWISFTRLYCVCCLLVYLFCLLRHTLATWFCLWHALQVLPFAGHGPFLWGTCPPQFLHCVCLVEGLGYFGTDIYLPFRCLRFVFGFDLFVFVILFTDSFSISVAWTSAICRVLPSVTMLFSVLSGSCRAILRNLFDLQFWITWDKSSLSTFANSQVLTNFLS